ncbi:MAG TPA: hypothetical protein VGZ73_28110 [Bryobacteraceae bacterium]|nr:hypothetical protein [Bryobacteraceae bacterium]
MRRLWTLAPAMGSLVLGTFCAQAQWTLTKEQMIAYTSKNPYDRFADGKRGPQFVDQAREPAAVLPHYQPEPGTAQQPV